MSGRHLLDPDLLVRGVPHDLYRRLRREQPVCWQELAAGGGYWAVLTHADVLAVSTQPDVFSSERKGMFIEDIDGLLPTLLNVDPPVHGEIRRPLIDAFGPRATAALESRMRAIVTGLFDAAREKGECDFATDLAAPLPMRIVGDLLGIPDEDLPRIGHWADVLAAADDPEIGKDLEGKKQNEAALELGMYAYGLGQRLAADGGSRGGAAPLVSRLMQSTLGGRPVDLAAFSGLFVQILIGGNETTRSLLCGSFVELARRPEVYRALREDPARIPLAVEEMLRWVTPVHYFRRTALADATVGRQPVRAGDRIVLVYASANRDEAVFAEPDRLEIGRDPNPHVAFGFGEHFCLGARIARLEARVFFEEFCRRFEGLDLCGEPARVRSNQLNSIKRMPVRLEADQSA